MSGCGGVSVQEVECDGVGGDVLRDWCSGTEKTGIQRCGNSVKFS